MRGRSVGARTLPTLKSSHSKEILQKWDGRVCEASEDAREMDHLQRKLDRLKVGGSARTTAAKEESEDDEESEEDSEEDDSEDVDYREE
jgi:Ran GTPase-activating protein (RanGAP) involved in mRNA processing and transport